MPNYKSSEEIWQELKHFEQTQTEKLNGALILIHPGTDKERKDKFYHLLDELIEYAYANGYQFASLN